MSGFIVKCRGGGLMVSDYECPVHGMFEATVERPAPETQPCPAWEVGPSFGQCHLDAERRITGTLGRVRQGEVTRGKSDPPPGPLTLDTRALADGMKPSEFKAQRDALWRDQRRAAWKAKL